METAGGGVNVKCLRVNVKCDGRLGRMALFCLFGCLCVLFIFMCLRIGGGFAIFVRKIEIAQGVSFYKCRPGKEKKNFIFFTNSKIVLA